MIEQTTLNRPWLHLDSPRVGTILKANRPEVAGTFMGRVSTVYISKGNGALTIVYNKTIIAHAIPC